MIHDQLGLPKAHYRIHRAVLEGLPLTLVTDLAQRLALPRSQVARWIGASFRYTTMSVRSGEIFCRLIETLDILVDLYEGDVNSALRWLTSPNIALSSDRPIDLLATESGCRAVLQLIRAIEYGLPV